MADDLRLSIAGLEDAKQALRTLPEKLRRRALRNALAAGARIVRDLARQRAPVIASNHPAVAKGYRKPGTVRDALVVRTSKKAQRAGDVGVFINVRPAKGAKTKTRTVRFAGVKIGKRSTVVRASQRGAKSPNDPFYWRFLEFGTRRSGEHPFLRPAAARLGDALVKIVASLRQQLAKMNVPGNAA